MPINTKLTVIIWPHLRRVHRQLVFVSEVMDFLYLPTCPQAVAKNWQPINRRKTDIFNGFSNIVNNGRAKNTNKYVEHQFLFLNELSNFL